MTADATALAATLDLLLHVRFSQEGWNLQLPLSHEHSNSNLKNQVLKNPLMVDAVDWHLEYSEDYLSLTISAFGRTSGR